MPFDISSIKVKTTTPPKREVTSRKTRASQLGENPWLDKTWSEGLWASYDADVAFSAVFPGAIEMVPAQRGATKGQLVEKVTGEAGDAIFLIRKASTILGIGAAVRWKKSRNGFVEVTWYGKTRKKKSETTDEDAPSGASVSE